jgi:putative membrane protein
VYTYLNMGLLINILINGLAVFLTALFLPHVKVDGIVTAIIVAIVLGIVNFVVKPILHLLTLPITILTLGLFSFVINALMILLVDYLVPGFHVDNFWAALLFSLVLSLVSSLLHSLTD